MCGGDVAKWCSVRHTTQAMIDELRALTAFAKGRYFCIDSLVFRLHSRLTTLCILVALFVVSTSQFIGQPIYCDSESLNIAREMLNAFCYINLNSTYTHNYSLTSNQSFKLFPGVGPDEGSTGRVYLVYYQWVWVIYFLQALCFYLPSWVWKTLEGGKLRALVSDLEILKAAHQSDSGDSECGGQVASLASYLHRSFGGNTRYVLHYFLCELSILLNIAAQFLFLDTVFDGNFLHYGLNTLLYWNGRLAKDPMTMVFPKLTKCSYRRFGPSGEVDIMDSLCMLPLNNFNDKFFLLLWFWMSLLTGLLLAVLLYRTLQLTSSSFRFHCLWKSSQPLDSKRIAADVREMVQDLSVGDWFLLYMVGHNVDHILFYEVLCQIIKTHKTTRTLKAGTFESDHLN